MLVFGQVAMEHKVEIVAVDWHLMGDFVLLIVKEVFQELFFFWLVILLADQALRPTHFVVAENGPVHDLLQHKLVFCVPHFVEYLSQSQSRQKRLEHFITSRL